MRPRPARNIASSSISPSRTPSSRLTFEDGTTVVSDGEGQYSFCGLTPTTHVLIVDRTTLPPGAMLVTSSSRNAGEARSQFVDVKNGEVRRVDFVEGSRDSAVLAEINARRAADAGWRPSFATEMRPTPVVAPAPTESARVISIGGTSMTLAETLSPAIHGFGGGGSSSNASPDMSMDSRPGSGPAPFAPGVRSMLVVGLLDGVLSLNTAKGGTRLPVTPGTVFERELTQLSGTFADGRGRYAGRGAVFVKGQVAGNIGITLAYDSEKDSRTTLFRDIQPESYYPIYGDASRKIFDAQTSGRLYARVDHGRSYALYGDLRASTLGGDSRRLGTYNRTLTGFQQRLEAGRVTVTGFASKTALHQVVDEIAALGLSGLYSVSHPNGVSGTERVEVITRDRNQTAVVVNVLPLTRFTDYEFEPFSGRLLFRRPVPSLDDQLNPVSIRVTYEIDDTLDGDATKTWVGGADAALRVTRRIEVGGGWIEDTTPGSPYRLRSVNSTVRLSSKTTLIVEGAESRGVAGTGASLTALAATGAEGAAARLELRHHSSRILAHAFAATADSGFSNPSAGFAPGHTEAGARGTVEITDGVKVIVEAVHSEDQRTGARRDGGMVAVEATIARALGVEVGVRRSSQTGDAGLGSSAFSSSSTDGFGLGPGGTTIDPVSGLPVSQSSLSTALTASPATAATGALDETTVRAKVTLMPSSRANVYAEAEQDIHDAAKRMAAVGVQVQVSSQNRAYARHEFLASLDSPYGLTGNQRRDATVVGIASNVTKDGNVFSEYRMRNAISGREAEAAIGLRNQWSLADGIHATAGFERLTVINGVDREATAVSGGLDYTRSANFKGTGRIEWRRDTTSESWLSTTGLAQRLSSSWTILAKNYYQRVLPQSGPGQVQDRFSVGGAYRNPTNNRVNVLSRYELRFDRALGAPAGIGITRRVQSVSTHIDLEPARGWTLSGQHAAKWVEDRTDGLDVSRAQLISGRMGYDLFRRWDVGALASLLWSPTGGREQAVGAEVGFLLRGNWWLSFGDNAVGFRDNDFEVSNATARGPFTRLRLKFD